MISEDLIRQLWEEKRIDVTKWTSRAITPKTYTTMFLRVFSRDPEVFELIKDERYDSRAVYFGPAGFEVLFTHKDITLKDYCYALIDHIHVENSARYPGCVTFMSKMTHIEYDMKKITEHFPLASIVDVDQAKGCWSGYEYYTVKLGEPIF